VETRSWQRAGCQRLYVDGLGIVGSGYFYLGSKILELIFSRREVLGLVLESVDLVFRIPMA